MEGYPCVRLLFAGSFYLLSWTAFAQQEAQRLKEVPLARDEFAVYKAFIDDERSRDAHEDLLVVDHTGRLTPDEGDYASCMKGFPQPTPKQHPRRFERRLEREWNVKLVGIPIKVRPEASTGGIILPNDAQKSPADGESNSRQTRYQGSIEFTEIIFDRQHHRAAIWATVFSNWGERGGTLVFRRVGQSWKESDACPTGIP